MTLTDAKGDARQAHRDIACREESMCGHEVSDISSWPCPGICAHRYLLTLLGPPGAEGRPGVQALGLCPGLALHQRPLMEVTGAEETGLLLLIELSRKK